MQAAAAAASSLQENVPALVEVKVKLAVVRSVGFVGVGAVIDATGTVRSIVQV